MAIIDKPNEYFNTVLYTGTGATQSITGVNFTPDLTWIKGRSGATEHVLTDSVRGVTKEISSNDTGAEETVAQGLTAFGTDGFTVGTDGSYNTSSATYASWNWKAGGTAVSNTDGSITSSVSANTTAGMSIVKYNGNSTSGATIGHGLGVVPKMIIIKAYSSQASGDNWIVYHSSMGNTKAIYLNLTNAPDTASGYFNDTTPTSSVFTVGNYDNVNRAIGDKAIIAYCFADVKGYSKFGSYIGNGNADGTFIYTGFKPAMIIRKSSTYDGTDWRIDDNKRPVYNFIPYTLFPNTNGSEATSSGYYVDFLSNGFKCRGTSANQNTSGQTYIYMAFAENPFVTSTGIPATAR